VSEENGLGGLDPFEQEEELPEPDPYEDIVAEETVGAYLDTDPGPRERRPEGDLPDDFDTRPKTGFWTRVMRALRAG